MDKATTTGQMGRERMMSQYLTALTQGNIDTVIEVLAKAEQDPQLEEMLWSLHQKNMLADLGAVPQMPSETRQREGSRTNSAEPGHNTALRVKRHVRKPRRVSSFLQTLVAVLTVTMIVGGFVTLFAARRSSTLGNGIPSNWCQPSVPGLNNSSSLDAVAAISSSNVWAVGHGGDSSGNKNRTLIEHWDGHIWRIVASPNLGTGDNFLSAVVALSPTNIWAVGQAFSPDQQYSTEILVEHWDGKQWSIIPTPNPAKGGVNRFFGISAISATDIWAVGSMLPSTSSLSGKPNETLIEHWDGRNWQVVASPNPGNQGGALESVVALSANDIWAVGLAVSGSLPLIEHWDGTSWKVAATPAVPPTPNGLNAITAVSADDVWAVGGGNANALIEHWNGTSWSAVLNPGKVNGPSQNGATLNGVVALAHDNVWAVGQINGVGQTTEQALRHSSALVEHWDGQRWQMISTLKPVAQLSSIAVTSSQQLWISGGSYTRTGVPYVAYSC